jgi:hypothetical protein
MAAGPTLKLKRGLHATLGTLAAGELFFETDTYKVFVGDGATNHEVGAGAGDNNGVVLAEASTGATIEGGTSVSKTLTIDDTVALTALLKKAGGTMTGALVAADHGTAANGEVVGICYGTGSPPTASTVPEGSLFVKYTA